VEPNSLLPQHSSLLDAILTCRRTKNSEVLQTSRGKGINSNSGNIF